MFALILSFLIMQPQGQIIWSAQGTGGIYSAVPTYDYNNDGHPDVAAAAYYGAYPSPPIRLFLFSGFDGTPIWTRPDYQGIWGNRGLATINDITGDSIPDIIMGTPGGIFPGRTVFAINGVTSDTLWTHPYYPDGGWVYCVRPMVDINHDGYPEVLAAVGGTTNDQRGTGECFSGHTGSSLWTFRPEDAGECIAPHVDINNDTIPEVILAAGGNDIDNQIYCLNGRNGARIWSYNTGGSVEYVASMDDVNNNGYADVVGGGWAYKVVCCDGLTGDSIWVNNLGTGRIIMTLVPIRDINNDGIKDVVVGSWSSLVTVLSGQNGSVLWSQTVGCDCWSVDTLLDITGDGIPEVVGGGVNGRNVKVMNGVTGEVLWYYNFVDRVYDVTGAPDLDGDGKADVLVSLQDQNSQPYQIYAFKGLTVGLEENNQPEISAKYSVEYRKGEVILKVAVPEGKRFGYQVFDVNGRILENNPFQMSVAEMNYIHIKKGIKPAGIYFIRLQIEGEKSQTAKIFLF
jgi:outer membrane protein assembly factor BamB